MVKLNVDAVVPKEDGKCTAGFIVRDSKGAVLMSGVVPISDCLSVLHAELLSIYHGLAFTIEADFWNLIVASDNISTVNACNGLDIFVDYLGIVVKEIMHLTRDCHAVHFVFEARCFNEVAHSMAKWGSVYDAPIIFMEEVPSLVMPCIVKDISYSE